MEILQLEYFCTAAELENFSAAANRHFIPQSAMSITIKRIENELGKQLFDRIGNRIRLNEYGKQFYVHAKNCITEFRNAKDSVKIPNEPYGEIHLLILEERFVLAKLVSEFQNKYPEIRFNISHNLYQQSSFWFDIRITSTKSNDNNLISASLLTDRLVLALSKQHPLATRDIVSLKELATENFATFPAEHSTYIAVTNACHKAGFIPKVTISCDDPLCLRTYISANLAIGIVPETAWSHLIDDTIALIPLEETDVRRETRIECMKSSMNSPAVNLFYNYCIEEIKKYSSFQPFCSTSRDFFAKIRSDYELL